jgi:23S rRNA (adenine-N6)-dimethyltransferase
MTAGQGGRSARDRRRRVLSQNLLRGPGVADWYLDRAPIGADELCVEVGAGSGVITERLADRCRRVIAFEVDCHLADQLRVRVRNRHDVTIEVADFRTTQPPDEPFHLVGNIPFSITSAIIDWALRAESMTAATVITQLEYAKKRAGSYGRWSLVTVRTWPGFTWRLLGRIPRREFRPVPRVDGAVLHIARREGDLIAPEQQQRYRKLVELGFTGVGGSLYASLRREHSTEALSTAFEAADLDRSTVVAFVHPDQWIMLFHHLDRGSGRH